MIRPVIVGYGKMGKRIADLASARGIDIHAIIDNENDWQKKIDEISDCDVAIEFTTPEAAPDNIKRLLSKNIPVVSGTTGWDERKDELISLADEKGVGLLIASNFSIGMNIFFELNKYLAKLMNRFPGYKVDIEETHHVHKLDAPSGTAKVLANDLVKNLKIYSGWLNDAKKPSENQIAVKSFREGEVTGMHKVRYKSMQDVITIDHKALNRDGFAIGALEAAHWIIGKKGFQTMEDMLFER